MWQVAAIALVSHWRRHPGQALTLVLGLALATALWTGVQAINAEARASYDRAAGLVSQNNRPAIRAEDGGDISLSAYVALRRAGWPVAPVIEGQAQIGGRNVTLIGLDPLSSPVLPDPAEDGPAGDGAGLLEFVGPPGQLFAEAMTATRLRGLVEQEVIDSPDIAPGTAIGDIAVVARLLDMPDRLSRLILLAEPPAGVAPLADLTPGLVLGAPDTGADMAGLTGSFHLNLTAFGLLSFTVGLFIVHGAIGLAFEQRRGMIRTLRALGLPARALVSLLAVELALVATVSGALGVGLGYLVAAALLPDVAATLRGLYGAPASDALVLRPGWVLAGFAMAWLGTAIAAAQALWRLIAMPVLAGANPRAWALASATGLTRQAWLGFGAALIGVLISLVADGLVAGFALLGGLLLGAALVLPPILALCLGVAEARAKRPLAQWFWADTRQQLPGLSLALMALMLALAANIGVSTMVGSFRATFTGWLDQRLAAEVYLDAGTEERAAAITDWLATRVDAILPQAAAQARLGGLPAQLQALPDHPTYRANWPLLSDPEGVWDALARGDGVLINEQFSYRSGARPGDTIDLDGQSEKVLAIYSDYGNPLPQAIIGMERFRDLHPDVPQTRFALRVPSSNVADVMDGLRNDFGLGADRLRDQASLKDLSQEIFDQTFAVTGALNVLTLGVAALAILTSLLTLATQRLPQVAPLWAMGLTRQTLGRLDLLRAAMLASLTAVLAIPAGLMLAWVLLAVVNVEAFGWRLPMQVFPGDWVLLTALALLAAVVAAALPARKLASRPPADLLKVFASER